MVPEGWILDPSAGGSSQMYLVHDPAAQVPVVLYQGRVSIKFNNEQVWKNTPPALLVSNKHSRYSVSWTMKTSSSFSYAFHVLTDGGVRTVEYVDQPNVSSTANRYKSQIPLGPVTTKKQWVRVRKDLWRDLRFHFPNLNPREVIGVDITGHGLINDLYIENTKAPASVVIAQLDITNPKAPDKQAAGAATTTLSEKPLTSNIQLPNTSNAIRSPPPGSDIDEELDNKRWSIKTHVMNSRTEFKEPTTPIANQSNFGLNVSYRQDNRYFALLDIKPDLSDLTNDFNENGSNVTDDEKPDHRFFFKENAELFGNDTDYFYSLRIPDIENGVKTYALLGDFEFALLATTSPEERNDTHLRIDYGFTKKNNISVDFVSSKNPSFDHQFIGTTLNNTFSNNLYYVLKASATKNANTGFSDNGTVDLDANQDTTSNAASAKLGWSLGAVSLSIQADRYSRDYFAPNTILDQSVAETLGSELGMSLYKAKAGPIKNINANVSVNQRKTLDGEPKTIGSFASLGAEISDYVRANIQYNDSQYNLSDVPAADNLKAGLSDTYWNLDTDFNIHSSRFGYGFSLANGILANENYEYVSAYSWFFPTNSLSFSLYSEKLQNFGDYTEHSLKTTWDINSQQSLLGKYSVGNDYKIWKLAYSHRFTRQLEMVLAYQQLVDFTDELTGKFSWKFL